MRIEVRKDDDEYTVLVHSEHYSIFAGTFKYLTGHKTLPHWEIAGDGPDGGYLHAKAGYHSPREVVAELLLRMMEAGAFNGDTVWMDVAANLVDTDTNIITANGGGMDPLSRAKREGRARLTNTR